MFETGDVTFIKGKVSAHAIKTTAQLEREAEIRQERAERWAERQEQERLESLAKGRAWLSQMRSDPGAVTDAQMQAIINHWRMVQQRYPETDIAADYEATLALLETREVMLREQREAARIADLERRVADAERRAAEAQQQAAEAQRERSYYNVGYNGGYYYPVQRPVVVIGGGNGYPCKPPRPRYDCNNDKPIIRGNVNTGNVKIQFSSGGGRSLTNNCFPQPKPRPIVVTHNES
ncbi:MAG: hypothetical protein ACQKBV_05800 [Puniceicoccales bacterium]